MARRRNPGVDIGEIDLTQIVEGAPTGIPAGVVGVAQTGPAFVPVLVGDFGDWQTRFGQPDGKPGPIAAFEWLQNAPSATYLRVLGIGRGERKDQDGRVEEAGFVVGEDNLWEEALNPSAYVDETDPQNPVQTPGRTYFLGAFHEDRRGFDINGQPTQDDLLFRAGIDTTKVPKPVVRGVLLTPRGVAATLFSTVEFNPTPLEAAVPNPADEASYGVNPGSLGGSYFGLSVRDSRGKSTSRLFLNGHIETPETPISIEFSFDPRDDNYFAKVLNRDPSKTEFYGHCLYAWWDIDPTRVRITGDGIFPEAKVGDEFLSVNSFLYFGRDRTGKEFDPTLANYECFEERYTEPVSPWVLSEELSGGVRLRLFRLNAIDSGSGANTKFKVAISNIQRTVDAWTTFTVDIRAWDDTDDRPVTLESYPGVNLNPDSQDYIVRRIGDRRIKHVWDVNPENQGLSILGSYPAVSTRAWCEVPQEVEDGLDVRDVVPVAHEGLPHLVVDGWDASDEQGLLWIGALFDYEFPQNTMPQGTFYAKVPASSPLEIPVGDASLFPVDADLVLVTVDLGGTNRATVFTPASAPIDWDAVAQALTLDAAMDDLGVTFSFDTYDPYATLEVTFPPGSVGNISIWTADLIPQSDYQGNLLANIRQTPVPFRSRLLVNARGRANQRAYWGFDWSQRLSTQRAAENWSKFFPDLGAIPFWSREAGVAPDPTFSSVLDVNTYNNNLFTLERVWVPTTATSIPVPAWATSVYLRDGVALPTTGRFVSPTDLSSPVARPYLKFSFPVFGGFDGLNILDRERSKLSDFAIYQEKEAGFRTLPPLEEPLIGPTYTAWTRAVGVLASEDDVDVQVVALPGIRHRSATDEAIRLVENRLDAVIIIDPELADEFSEYETDIRGCSVTGTIDRWLLRQVDSTFAATFFPDVISRDPVTARSLTLPATVSVLGVLAQNDAIAFPWFAAAGYNRGILERVEGLPINLEEEAQGRLYDAHINPLITRDGFRPVVWGNKTTRQTESVLNRLNVRRLLIAIRRRVREVSKGFLFEPNVEATLASFQSTVEPILQEIRTNRGLQNFVVYIDPRTTTALDVQNGVIRGAIGIQPTQSAEFAEIDFEVRNEDE
jgi:hypothetical protein